MQSHEGPRSLGTKHIKGDKNIFDHIIPNNNYEDTRMLIRRRERGNVKSQMYFRVRRAKESWKDKMFHGQK